MFRERKKRASEKKRFYRVVTKGNGGERERGESFPPNVKASGPKA